MIRIITKDGLVDSEGYLLDKDGKRIKKYKPFEFDVRNYNIVQTYFWFYDLHGKLKQEIKPPADYHGNPRAYIKEDVEEDREDNTITSHLRYYLGKKLIAYDTITVPEFSIKFIEPGYEDAESRLKVRQHIRFLLDGGWAYFKIESRRKRKSPTKTKRILVKKPSPHKTKKVILKKRIVKKRK